MGTQRLPVAAMGALAALLASITFGQESVDLGVVHRIKTEAFENSKVMDHLFYLNDVYGPRLTNSTGFFAAVAWAVKTLGEWGILAHVEKWNYGRGWNYTHFEAHLLEPQYASLIGFPLVSVRSGIAPSQGGTVFSGVGAGTWDPKVPALPASVL